MNYEKHYAVLIDRARTRLLEGYTEQHHIIPKCLGGNNSPDNLVYLTAEEHYVAHQLLVRMYPGNDRLVHAAKMMTVDANGMRVNNKLYGWLKVKHAKLISKILRGKPQSQEHKDKRSEALKKAYANGSRKAWNKGKKWSEETRHKMSIAQKGRPNTKAQIPLIIKDIQYESHKQAADTFGITTEAIRYWVKTGKHGAQLV